MLVLLVGLEPLSHELVMVRLGRAVPATNRARSYPTSITGKSLENHCSFHNAQSPDREHRAGLQGAELVHGRCYKVLHTPELASADEATQAEPLLLSTKSHQAGME